MRISDKERREVAQKLRHEIGYMRKHAEWYEEDVASQKSGNRAYRNIASAVFEHGNIERGFIEVVERVAELIDRPTCRNIYAETEKVGGCENGFKCSECGNMVEDYEGYRISGEFNLCPKCGAEVIE